MAGKELTASQVRAITAPGKHRVAPNLFLFIADGRRSWMFRGTRNGNAIWRGLGSTRIVPLGDAKAAALKMRLELHHGQDTAQDPAQQGKGRQDEHDSVSIAEGRRQGTGILSLEPVDREAGRNPPPMIMIRLMIAAMAKSELNRGWPFSQSS